MPGLDIFSPSWVVAAGTILFASFIRATTGFGQSLIMAPILLLFLSPKSAIVVSQFLGLLIGVLLLPSAFKNREMARVLPLIGSTALGVPIGAYVIRVIDPSALKIAIGTLCVSLAIPLALGLTITLRRERLAVAAVGLLSGIFNAATSLGGPPVVLYMHSQNWRKETIHSTLNLLFAFQNALSLLALYFEGLVDRETALVAGSLAPVLLVGLGLGMLAFPRVRIRLFRLLSIAVVMVGGILAVLSGLGVF